MPPGFCPKPNRSPAQRVRFGKEEQRRERALTFTKKSEQAIQSLLRRGAGGGTRTHTESPPADFESATSTIPSHRRTEYFVIIRQTQRKCKRKFHSCRQIGFVNLL